MFVFDQYLAGLGPMLVLALVAWAISVMLRNVGIVDSMWAIFFLAGACAYTWAAPMPGPRAALVLILVALWGVRLAGYITWRNWGEGEDHRYQTIRSRNEPHFAVKSLYLVFGLQAVLAWIISLPLHGAITAPALLSVLDYAGVTLFLFGFAFESIGDYQLARFKSDPRNRGQVMNRGLWRYTRHPNYFGEFCLWWGFYLIALAAGAWWSVLAPLLMSFLLLKVSGVALLEKDIGERRPGYRRYIESTPAFFPGRPKSSADVPQESAP